MQVRYVACSIAVGFGCGGTASPAPSPPAPRVDNERAPAPAKPRRPEVVAPTPPPSPPPPQIVDSAIARIEGAPACTLHGNKWFGKLSFARDAVPFASVLGASTVFSLPQTGTGMFAQVGAQGIRIGAWVHAPTLHLARSITLSKVVYPRPAATVGWEGLRRTGAVAISLDVTSALSEPAIARADVACKDLAIEETSFKLPPSIPKAAEKEIILNGEAALSTTPGGKPVAKVQASPTAKLLIAGKRGAATHIVLDDPNFVVHGWIPSSMLEQGSAPISGHGVGTGQYAAKITLPNSGNHGCVRDLPLFVEMAGSRAELGVLVVGSPYPKLTANADAAGYVEVEPYGRQWLVLANGARLLVRDSDLARCHTP